MAGKQQRSFMSKIIEGYSYIFSALNKPQAQVVSGETVTFKTLDCFSGRITSEQDLTTHFNYDSANPATGPVYVEEARPGDILVAEILDIRTASRGVVTTLPGCGPLSDTQQIRTKPVDIIDGQAQFNDIRFPVEPMVGVIGVAPADAPVACGFPGRHGGNMDCKKIGKGAVIYFPVQVSGALFALGDLHAVMGDGELCGTGLEIAGEVDVRLSILRGPAITWPVLETADKWYAIASAAEYPAALKHASEQLQSLICSAYGWDLTDTYMYMSLQSDAEICQACKPCAVDLIVRVGAPKLENKPLINREVK